VVVEVVLVALMLEREVHLLGATGELELVVVVQLLMQIPRVVEVVPVEQALEEPEVLEL
jgi:hypothetical protein